MMRKVGLEADLRVPRVILLQVFATLSLQFNIFLKAIIRLTTPVASIMFYNSKKTLRSPELKVGRIFSAANFSYETFF